MYCHTCGGSEFLHNICRHCNNPAHTVTVPSCIPHAKKSRFYGIHNLDKYRFDDGEEETAQEVQKPQEEVKQPTDWFLLSSKLVKWTGWITTLLIITFFAIVLAKAFM